MTVGRGQARIQLPNGTEITIPSAIYSTDVTTNLISFRDIRAFRHELHTDGNQMKLICRSSSKVLESFPETYSGIYKTLYKVPYSRKLHWSAHDREHQ